MATTAAFEVTEDDVANVLSSNALAVANSGGKSFAEMAAEIFPTLDFELIEEAALAGDSMDEQTDYAHDEITRQLREQGVLEPPRLQTQVDFDAYSRPNFRTTGKALWTNKAGIRNRNSFTFRVSWLTRAYLLSLSPMPKNPLMKKLPRPDYQALDDIGLEYTRPARVVGELPHADRQKACDDAAAAIAAHLGLPAPATIKFGVPVHNSFGMTRPQAKNHKQSKLLLTPGDDVSLDFCPMYEAAHVL